MNNTLYQTVLNEAIILSTMSGYGTLPEIKRRLINLINNTPNRYYQCHGTSNEIECPRSEFIRSRAGDSKRKIINKDPNKSNNKLVINKTSNIYDHDNKCKLIINNIIDNNPDISIKNICKIKKIVNKKYRHLFKHILNDKGYLTKKLFKQYVIYLNDI